MFGKLQILEYTQVNLHTTLILLAQSGLLPGSECGSPRRLYVVVSSCG